MPSWTSTGYFSNSTGSSVTNCRLSRIIGYELKVLGRPSKCTWGGRTLKTSPQTLRTVIIGQGQPPVLKKLKLSGPARKLLPAGPISKKFIALAFFKATYPYISYWVHFTLKVQNPIYIRSLPLSKWAIDSGFIVKVKWPIKHVINLEVKDIKNTLSASRL